MKEGALRVREDATERVTCYHTSPHLKSVKLLGILIIGTNADPTEERSTRSTDTDTHASPRNRVQAICGSPSLARSLLDVHVFRYMPAILLTQTVLPIYSAITLWIWCVIEVMLSGGRSNALRATLTSQGRGSIVQSKKSWAPRKLRGCRKFPSS